MVIFYAYQNILRNILRQNTIFMDDSIKDRLLTFIDHIGSNPRQFSKSLGRSDSYVRTIGKSMGSDVIGNILLLHPNLNVNWLITGNGDMLLEKSIDNPDLLKIQEENRTLKKENEDLKKQVWYLQGQVDLLLNKSVKSEGA